MEEDRDVQNKLSDVRRELSQEFLRNDLKKKGWWLCERDDYVNYHTRCLSDECGVVYSGNQKL